MNLFDAHAHLQDERLTPLLDNALSEAQKKGVTKISSCGSSESDWPDTLALAKKYPDLIVPSCGLHPWYIAERSSDWLDKLEQILRESNCGLGEIGLDFALKNADLQDQEKVFLEQLSLAKKMDKPVSIHCRQAWGRFMELVRESKDLPRMMVHSYSGAPDLVKELTTRGIFLSFSGTLTRSGNTRGHRSAQTVPSEFLLIETDSPDLPPAIAPYINVKDIPPNVPANLVYVLEKMASLRGETPEAIAEQTFQNAHCLFVK